MVYSIALQQGRTGTLFEGRFRHVLIDREEYLLHLCRYIHLNPIHAGLVSQCEDWPYSNYLEWVGRRPGVLKDQALIRMHFPTPELYAGFVTGYQDEVRTRERIQPFIWD